VASFSLALSFFAFEIKKAQVSLLNLGTVSGGKKVS
jgi:hypothetical protein